MYIYIYIYTIVYLYIYIILNSYIIKNHDVQSSVILLLSNYITYIYINTQEQTNKHI